MAEQQTRKIIVTAQTNGDRDLKRMANSLDQVTKSAKNIDSAFSSLKNVIDAAFGASILGFGISQLTAMADSITNLNSKINIFIGGGQKAKDTFDALISLANETKTPFQSVATVFNRIAGAMQNSGLAADTLVSLTRVLQQSFRVSGATTEEATSATIQFTQALSKGKLNGDELNSVMEQNLVIAGILKNRARELGVELRDFAKGGGLTTQFVLDAIFKSAGNVEKQAQGLANTFESSLNIAMNKFTVSVGELNKQFGISEGFATFVNFMVKEGPDLISIITVLGVTAIPKLTASLVSLTVAFVSSPVALFSAAIAGLTAAAIYTAGGVKQLGIEIASLLAMLGIGAIRITEFFTDILTGIAGPINPFQDFFDKGKEEIGKFGLFLKEEKDNLSIVPTKKEIDPLEEYKKALADLKNMMAGIKTEKIKDQLGELNIAFYRGKIGLDEYLSKLNRLEIAQLEQKLSKGKITLRDFNKEMEKLKLESISREFEYGKISIEQFDKAVNEFKIENLQNKFKAGKISAQDFKEELQKLRLEGMDQNSWITGIQKGLFEVSNTVGTFASNFSTVTINAFKNMEDAIFEATKSGRLDFATMTQGILDDLTKIAIRMAIVKPLAEGLLGGLFGPSTAAPQGQVAGATQVAQPFAMGGVFSGGIQKFASGGVVNSPTYFGIGRSKMGVMGEAGPEAIVPLRRGSDGSLGVSAAPTIVNINNMTNSEVTASEKTNSDGSKSIEVFIKAKVKEAIVNGEFDRQMDQSYALKRRGV